MVGGELLQLGHQLAVAPQGQLGLDPLLDGGQPVAVQAGGLGMGERLGGEVGQRRAAPQPQGLVEVAEGEVGGAVGLGPAGLLQQPLELVAVEPGGVVSSTCPLSPPASTTRRRWET